MGKVIYWKLYKKLKFDDMNKCYMHNAESIRENETHELLWDLETQTDHLISARRPDQEIVSKKRTCRIVDFAVPVDHSIKLIECKRRDRYLDLDREQNKNFGPWK